MKSPKAASPLLNAKTIEPLTKSPCLTKSPYLTKSPCLEKELVKIQNSIIKGKSADYMKGLEDFCLD